MTVLQWGLLVWLLAFAAILAWRMLTGQISLYGLLGQDEPLERATPERLQMLAAVVISAAAYIQIALQQGPGSHATLPEAPAKMIGFFGASHAIYLSTKLGRRLYAGRKHRRDHSNS